MQDNGSRRKQWLVIGVTALGLLLILFFIDFRFLADLFRRINWLYLVGAIAVLLLGYLFLTLRLRHIFLNQPGWGETFYANNTGFALNATLFMPAMIARAVCLSRGAGVPLARASSGLLVERLLEQILRLSSSVLAIILVAGAATDPSISIGLGLVLLIVVFGAIIWVVNHREQVVDSLAARLSGFRRLSEAQVRSATSGVLQGLEAVSTIGRLLVALLLSFASWTSFLIFQVLVLVALDPDLQSRQILLVASVVLAVMPPSINIMLIVYQVVVVVTLVSLGLTDTTTAVAYAITLHLMLMILWLPLGGWSLRHTNLKFQEVVQAVRMYSKKGEIDSEGGETPQFGTENEAND